MMFSPGCVRLAEGQSVEQEAGTSAGSQVTRVFLELETVRLGQYIFLARTLQRRRPVRYERPKSPHIVHVLH